MQDLEQRAKYLKKIISGKCDAPMRKYKAQAEQELKQIEQQLKGYPRG